MLIIRNLFHTGTSTWRIREYIRTWKTGQASLVRFNACLAGYLLEIETCHHMAVAYTLVAHNSNPQSPPRNLRRSVKWGGSLEKSKLSNQAQCHWTGPTLSHCYDQPMTLEGLHLLHLEFRTG